MKKVICFVLIILCVVGIFIERLSTNKLLVAVKERDYQNVERFINMNAYLNGRQYTFLRLPALFWFNPTPLIQACRNTDVTMVKMLVEAGADVNKQDNFTHTTPLTTALRKNDEASLDIAMYLIENGADISGKLDSDSPLSAMARFVYSNQTEMEKWYQLLIYLVENGSNAYYHYMKDDGSPQINALEEAARYSKLEMVQCLISNNIVDIDALGVANRTALYSAVINEDEDMVRLLLENGADMNIPNEKYDNLSPYQYAETNKLARIVELMNVLPSK